MMTAIPASKKANKPISDQLQCLIEVFPTWKAEDLNAVLNEVGGDTYLAINRISEGHVNQWSDGKKPSAPTEDASSSFSAPKNQRKPAARMNDRPPRRNETSERKPVAKKATQEPLKKTSASQVSWDSPAPSSGAEVSWDATVRSNNSSAKAKTNINVPTTSKTSFADALTSSNKPAPAKTQEVEVKVATAIVVENVEVAAKVVIEEPAAVPVAVAVEPEVVVEEVKCEEVCACSADAIEDDCVVQLPSRPNMPSLTMEQPAVILPIRVPMRPGLSVRFGFDREEGIDAPSVNTSTLTVSESPAPTEHISAPKTSISVAALESSFAMLSATESSKSISKSPEPAFFEAPSAPTYLHHHHHQNNTTSPQPQVSSASAYARGRSGWDYETASNSSFGPAPGFSASTASASNVAPRMNRATAHYESGYGSSYSTGANRYSAASSYNDYQGHQAEMHQSFMTGGTGASTGANNNVSQYYTSNTGNRSNTATSYPMYNRPSNNSFNANANSNAGNRYSTGLNRPNAANVASPSTTHYYQPHQQHYASPYSGHQNYLAHQGYHHPSAVQEQQPQPQHQQSHHLYSHQPYYQPYQPPHQYLSNNNSNNTQNNL